MIKQSLSNKTISAVAILAGGQSQRMGQPKALLTLPSDESLLSFHIRHAGKLHVPILIADNGKNLIPKEDVSSGSPIYNSPDYIPHAGALSAIAGAMTQVLNENPNASSTDFVLVMSCDTLIPIHQLWKTLAKSSVKHQVHYLKDIKNQQDYPLLGLYRLDILPTLKTYLDQGNRAVMKFLASQDTKTHALPETWQKLANLNTQEAFQNALCVVQHLRQQNS